MKSSVFGKLPDGRNVKVFKLQNEAVTAEILNYGAVIRALYTPDRNGNLADIILGYDSFEPYINNPTFMGSAVGRYANRIANGSFNLDGKWYQLEKNNGPCCLHGGINQPLQKVLWDAIVVDDHTLELSHKSLSMIDGFPGNVDFKIIYRLTRENELIIEYHAETDEKTVINLTNHSYFNLSGKNQSILDHQLMIKADEILKVDKYQVPMEAMPVEGTPFDFRVPKMVGRDIHEEEEQLRIGHGYDSNWIINPEMHQRKHAVQLLHSSSGRKVDVFTSEPGIQIYTANHLDHIGKQGFHYQKHYGICLETQHYPDSPNRPEFPSTILEPGKKFRSETIFRIGID
ncbi:MAG: aldose epimerase family protein [Bacteroidota bacterium]